MRIPRLREWREARALIQVDLAEKAGVSPRTVAGLEAGGSARLDTVRKLANALEIEVTDLMEEEALPKAQAPSEGGFSEREIALAQAYLEQRGNAHRLLSALQHIANAIASSWEESGRELSLDEIRASLAGLEAMTNAGIIEIRLHKHNDLVDTVVDTRVQDHADGRELEMLHMAVARLRKAAEPVFERERAQRERSRFEVIEGALATSTPAA